MNARAGLRNTSSCAAALADFAHPPARTEHAGEQHRQVVVDVECFPMQHFARDNLDRRELRSTYAFESLEELRRHAQLDTGCKTNLDGAVCIRSADRDRVRALRRISSEARQSSARWGERCESKSG